MALSAAYQVKEVYQNAEIAEDSFYDGNVKVSVFVFIVLQFVQQYIPYIRFIII